MSIKSFRKQIAMIVCLLFMASLLYACSDGNNTIQTTTLKESATSSVDATSRVESSENESKETTEPELEEPTTLDPGKTKSILESFLNADDLYLKMFVTYTTYIQSPVNPKTFEVWSRGLNYRSDEYEGNAIKFVIIVKDKVAKQYSMKSKSILEPFSTPQNYTDYYKWDSAEIDDGTVSPDGKYIIYMIDGIDKFYKKDSAKAGYYYTKVEFGVNNTTILYTTLYGNSSYGEKPSGVNAVTQTYEFVKINEGFNDSIFEAPF